MSSPLAQRVAKAIHKQFDFLCWEAQEYAFAVAVTKDGKVKNVSLIATGSYRFVDINHADLVLEAVMQGCPRVVLAHSHPRGTLKPSEEDIRLTKVFDAWMAQRGFILLDHIIITPDPNNYLSLRGHLA